MEEAEIKIHNLIQLDKFFLFPNFGSNEFDPNPTSMNRNSKLDFSPYEGGEKRRLTFNGMVFRTTKKGFLVPEDNVM